MDQDQENRDVSQIDDGTRQQSPGLDSDEGYRVYHGVNLLEERDRQRQELGSKLQELNREIESSHGYRLRNKISLLKGTYFVFDTNYLNLKHTLNEFEQPMVFLKLWEEKSRERLDLFINDVTRLFHNYLAGAMTLLDHVRRLYNDVSWGTDFSKEYQARWERQFGERSLPVFLEELLSYLLYEGFPFTLAELNFGKVGGGMEISSAIRLDVRRLGEWERWSKKGSEHLNSLEDKAKFEYVINEHAASITDFYQWFLLRFSELNQEAFEELEGLEKRSADLEQQIESHEDFLETAEKTTISMREEREKLIKELEAERQYREWEKIRADRLEAALEAERNRGFFRRVSGR